MDSLMFTKILIANRGEIACRVIETARRMGIATVAVYSDADATARHVTMADEAYAIGPAPARESYLVADAILGAARQAGAQAIHPGYGFLSENAAFAAACAAAGIVFIGPPVEAPEALAAAIDGAKREAAASFGDDRLLIERYLTRPRHIEIQIFADGVGNIVSLFERDCSIQRRHQKVIEEAPAPGMDPARRRVMGDAAIAAARAVGYVGAGTVEFIAEGDAFYFMEMNTRLQVEHPVTEMITGLDLVEWQVRVASGEALPKRDLSINGHAIEARIYAEDPARDFLPSVGTLLHLRPPRAVPGEVRVDTGVRQGDRVTPDYDPMIAKLVVWGPDRQAAVRRLAAALAEYEVVGVQTNLGLLRAIADHAAFAAADLDTSFIGRHPGLLAGVEATPRETETVAAAAALTLLGEIGSEAVTQAAAGGDPWSPWSGADAWRLNGDGYQDLYLQQAGAESAMALRAHPRRDGHTRLDLPAGPALCQLRPAAEGATLLMDGVARPIRVVRHGRELTVILAGRNHVLVQRDMLAPPRADAVVRGRGMSPIPGRVAKLFVAVGDVVEKNAPLLVIEAMKMEMALHAPTAGTVLSVRCLVEEIVEGGVELVTFAPVAP
jgi:3-methylcrotonyl-CoA carboxylase alpha subunit